MKKTTGTYDPSTIKWFAPVGVIITDECPHCGESFSIDAGDDFLEYPKLEEKVPIECGHCDTEFDLQVKIKMIVEIEWRSII